MDNDFDASTNVMSGDVIRELTERIRRPSVPAQVFEAPLVEEAAPIVELEALPEEPRLELPPLVNLDDPAFVDPAFVDPVESPIALEPPIAVEPPIAAEPRWVWPATLLTVAAVAGFYGGSALTPIVVFVKAHGSSAVAAPIAHPSRTLASAPQPIAPRAEPPALAKVTPPPTAVAQPTVSADTMPAQRHHHHQHHSKHRR
jgi:hypothetical protein